MKVEIKCRDYGQRPECQGEPDPAYTMDFTDIDQGYLYWCSHCGPGAHALDKLLTEFMVKSPENLKKVQDALDKIKCNHQD